MDYSILDDAVVDAERPPAQRGDQHARSSPLGINTKYVAALPDDAALSRLLRFELQAVARSLLPEERIKICLICRRPTEDFVRVLRSPRHGTAHYGGLMVCGSVWFCAVCTSKISERRRGEIETALKYYRSLGGVVYLATFTFAHTRSDELQDVLDRFLAAYRSMCQSRRYRSLSERFRIEGFIKALEVTWGVANGWHPHAHVLLFLHSDVDRVQLENDLYFAWSAAAGRRGLSMNRERGLKVQYTTDAVDKYVAKYGRPWSAADELVKAHQKRGRGESYTPFDLLRVVAVLGESWPAPLFREYAAVFKGRRQLVWSDGLRVLLQLGEEKSDQALADEIDEDAVVLALLSARDWYAVRHFKQRGQLLEVARSGDSAAVRLFVSDLVRRYVGLPV